MMPLRRRLALTHAVALTAALAAACFGAQRRLAARMSQEFDASLISLAAVQAAAADARREAPGLPPAHAADLAGLYDSHGQPQPGTAMILPLPDLQLTGPAFRSVTLDGAAWRYYQHSLVLHGRPYYLAIARPLAAVQARERAQQLGFFVLLLPGLVLAGLAGNWLAGRALAPLRTLAADARRIGPGDPDQRLAIPATGDEMAQVAVALNAMLARLSLAPTAQERFLHDAAHEVRTPLAAMRACLEVALRRPRSGEEYVVVLEDALAETERLSQLVNQLLAQGRQQEPLRLTVIRLDEAADAALKRFQPAADLAGIHLVRHGAGMAWADPERLDQILDNLLSNALRYSPAGSQISVSIEPGHRISALRVTDSGPGIAVCEHEAVFQRFYRTDTARSRPGGGAGLGLSICRAIAEAHGGRIGIEASPVGTVVHLQLPAP